MLMHENIILGCFASKFVCSFYRSDKLLTLKHLYNLYAVGMIGLSN